MTVMTRMPGEGFFISIEVVPPAGPDADPLLTALAALVTWVNGNSRANC